jgi:hypothetical protein
VHTFTKQWSLCRSFGKNDLKSMWCYNLIKHLVISRTKNIYKGNASQMDLWDFLPTPFWSIQPCVYLPCCIMLWNIVEKSQINMKNKFLKKSPCAKHNLEFVFNLYYNKFVDYHTMIGNHIHFSELLYKKKLVPFVSSIWCSKNFMN